MQSYLSISHDIFLCVGNYHSYPDCPTYAFLLCCYLFIRECFPSGGVIKYIIKVEDTEVCHIEPFAFLFLITGLYAIGIQYFLLRSFLAEDI